MRTGIFAYLASKIVKDSKEPFSFGKEVLEAVKNSKGTTEEELAGEMKGVLDSMSVLKDCEAKDTLLDVVKDCFDNKDKAIANEGELTKTLDSMWIDIHGDSLKEIAKAFAKLSEPKAEGASVPANDTDPQNKDSEPEKKDEGKEENKDSEPEKKDEGKEENKDSEPEKKEEGKDGCNKDSAVVMTKDDMLAVIKDALPEMVKGAVKEVLGIKDGAEPKVEGSVLDSANKTEGALNRDYSSFLE